MDMYNLKQIPTETQIKKYLRRIIFGKNIFCPECKSRLIIRYEDRYRCKKCRIKFSLLSHTWLSNMKLPWEQWWMLLWCWTTQIPVKQTQKLTHLSEKAVRHWFDQFRYHLPEEEHILERIIQLDEAFFKKIAVMIGKEIGTRKLAFRFIFDRDPNKTDACSFLFQKVAPGSKLWTDGSGIYRGVSDWWPVEHQRDIHRKFEFGYTSEIEGIFACLRTFIRRMYHHVTQEKLPDYVREFCFRFSSPEIFENPLCYAEKTLTLVPRG